MTSSIPRGELLFHPAEQRPDPPSVLPDPQLHPGKASGDVPGFGLPSSAPGTDVKGERVFRHVVLPVRELFMTHVGPVQIDRPRFQRIAVPEADQLSLPAEDVMKLEETVLMVGKGLEKGFLLRVQHPHARSLERKGQIDPRKIGFIHPGSLAVFCSLSCIVPYSAGFVKGTDGKRT